MATVLASCELLSLTGVTSGCARRPPAAARDLSAESAPWFEDATAECGLDFVHDAGPLGTYFFPQIMGSGAALFDYDGDGRLDVYLIHNGGPNGQRNKLFRQNENATFSDVSAESGLDVAGYGMGVACADIDNDGKVDLLLTEYGRTRLFLNRGGRFIDITESAGISNRLWGTSAAFVDYDRDGWLDLVLVNYVNYDPGRSCFTPLGRADYCGPKTFEGTAAKLYRNLGTDRGGTDEAATVRFSDETLSSGLGRLPGPGLGVVCVDFDGDRWPDFFVANDGRPNHLWMNQRDGTFREEATLRGVAYNAVGGAEGNMGIALGDVNGDGAFDVFVTHLISETPTLWAGELGSARGNFRDATVRCGLASGQSRATGFGTVLADFVHRGVLDLAVVNGGVTLGVAAAGADPKLAPFWTEYAQRNALFVNDGRGAFRGVSQANAPFCATPAVTRTLVCGDIDNDGDLDLLTTAVAGRAKLYRNVAAKQGHWIGIRAVDSALGGRDAYGAEVTVSAGGRRRTAWINPGYSYLCSNDPRAHFGLGENGRLDDLAIIWPDGSEERFPGGATDRYITVQKGSGVAAEGPRGK